LIQWILSRKGFMKRKDSVPVFGADDETSGGWRGRFGAELDAHARPAGGGNSAQERPASRRLNRDVLARRVAPFLAAAVAAALFWPSLKGGFLNGDDYNYITANSMVIGNGKGIFTTSTMGYYHPLTIFSYRLEWLLFGSDAAAFHAGNIALHAANCILFYYLAAALGAGIPGALLASLLFAVHPLRAEPVAWISGRKDLLSCFFLLAMLLAYIRYVKSRDWRNLALSCALLIAAMLSKPTVALGVAVLVLLDWHFNRIHMEPAQNLRIQPQAPFLSRMLRSLRLAARPPRSAADEGQVLPQTAVVPAQQGGRETLFGIAAEKIPFIIASSAVLALSFTVGKFYLSPSGVGGRISLADKLALCGYGEWFYLCKVLFPAKLCPLYPHLQPSGNFLLKYLPAAAFAALLALLARYCRNCCTGVAFFGLMLLAVLPFQILPADRYTYIPAAGVFLALGTVFDMAFAKFKITAAACASALLLALSCISVERVKLWGDSVLLCSDTISKYRRYDNWKSDITVLTDAFAHRSVAYFLQGKYAESIADINAALSIDPSYGAGYGARGAAYSKIGLYAQAESDYNMAACLAPGFAQNYVNRARLRYYALKQYAAAMADITRAAEISPDWSVPYQLRSEICAEKGLFDQALADADKALELAPSPGLSELRARIESARRSARNSGHVAETDATPGAREYAVRGYARILSKQFGDAVSDLTEALRLNPNDAESHFNRGIAYGNMGLHERALADFDVTLSINPKNSAAAAAKSFAARMLRANR